MVYVLLSLEIPVLIYGAMQKGWRVRASLPGTLTVAHRENFHLSIHDLPYSCSVLTGYVSFKRGCIVFSQEKKMKEQDGLLLLRALFLLLEEGRVEFNQTGSFWNTGSILLNSLGVLDNVSVFICLLFLKCIEHTLRTLWSLLRSVWTCRTIITINP